MDEIFVRQVKLMLGERTPYWLAKSSGLSHATISRIFAGKMKPSLESVEAIAKGLGVNPQDLISEKEQKVGIPADILSMLSNQDKFVYDAIRGMLKPITNQKYK